MKPLTTLLAILLCTGVMAQQVRYGLFTGSTPKVIKLNALKVYNVLVTDPLTGEHLAYKDSTGWHITDTGKTVQILLPLIEQRFKIDSILNERLNGAIAGEEHYFHYYQDYKRLRDSVDNANPNSFKNFMGVNAPHYEPLTLVGKCGSYIYHAHFGKPLKKRKKHVVKRHCTYFTLIGSTYTFKN